MAAETTPPLRDAQKPWGGHPSCDGTAGYLISGTVGQWYPVTGQWWNERKGGDPRTDQVTKELTHKSRVGIPKRLRPNCPSSTKKGALEPAWVASVYKGERAQGHQRAKGIGPKDLGVAAPLTAAGCRGNCLRVVDGRQVKIDLRISLVTA